MVGPRNFPYRRPLDPGDPSRLQPLRLPYRSREFVRRIFATAIVGLLPVVLLVASVIASSMLSLSKDFDALLRTLSGFSFLAAIAGQFFLIHRSYDSMTMQPGERRAIVFSALFFTIGPILSLIIVLAI